MPDAVLQATIRAFDEFSDKFQKLQQELRKTDQEQKKTAQGAEQLNRSISSFFQTIGQLGALYAFQRGLRDVMSTGQEFELTIRQAQAVTDDFSSTLRDLAMATKGGNLDVYGPTELAKTYRELGQAGASTNEIIAATPDILEFGTAAMLDLDKAAYGVLATAKSFNIALTDTKQIVDAYTEAMNRGALSGQDFQWIMSSVGAVAKMAGQDFREILSVGSAMRDAGVQAQDAGTSIKSALLQLINPTKEAQDTMKVLGINIYDASGKMKQWSEITAEFERALAPFNEQSRQLVLTTIFGSDGIRAMATSLNKGSGYLREFTEGLKTADGATYRMASAMADTFDGALRKANANLERAKILLFEDFTQSAVNVLGAINTLLVGFNNLDAGGRKVIEMIVGAAGLVTAISALVGALRVLQPILTAMGITTAALSGPIGLAVAAISALTAAGVGLTLQMSAQKAQMEEQNRTIVSVGEQYFALEQKLSTLQQGTAEYKTTQDRLNAVIQEIERIMPGAIAQWDAEGRAIAVGNDILRERIAVAKAAIQETARTNLQLAMTREAAARQRLEAAQQEEEWTITDTDTGQELSIPLPQSLRAERIRKAREEWERANAEVKKYSALVASEGADSGDWKDRPPQVPSAPYIPPGTRTFTVPESGGKGTNEAAEAAKKYTEAITEALYPYRAATEAAANAVSILGAKEQYLSQVMQSGQGTAYQAVELNKVRTEQLAALSAQQEDLHRQAEAERAALAELQAQYEAATDPDAAKELRQEMENLTRSTFQLQQAWWQAEQQKLSLAEQVRQEEKKRYDDAYQQAMDLMRHQVTIARMSTEQQIEYLERLRDAHQWTQQQMWSIEEDLFRLRKQQLSDYLSQLDDEYKSKLDAIEARTRKATDDIQAQIDALEGEGKAASREEAARKHNEKLAELQEKRRYHELRTGKEHQKAIAEIDKEIAEEQRQFELQQQEWTREDKKEALQKQLDDARKAGDEERKQLEDHYRKARKIAESGIMDVIASLSATKPQWLQTGKDLIDALIDGLESGDFSRVESKIEQIRSQAPSASTQPQLPVKSGGGSIQKSVSEMTWEEKLEYYKNHVSEAMAEITRAGQVYMQKWAAGDIEGARAAHRWADQIRKAIGQPMVWDENTEPSESVHNSYARGGPILYDQIAKLHAGEYVLPANLVDAIRRMTLPPNSLTLPAVGISAIEKIADRIVAAIESRGGVQIGTLFNAQEVRFEDERDMEILGRELRRQIMMLG